MKPNLNISFYMIVLTIKLAGGQDFTPSPGNQTHCPDVEKTYTASGFCVNPTWTITNGKIRKEANNTITWVTTLTAGEVSIKWDDVAEIGTLKATAICGSETPAVEKKFSIRSLNGRNPANPQARQSLTYCSTLTITLSIDVMYLLNTGGTTGVTQQRADGYEWVLPAGWSGNGSTGKVTTSEEFINITPDNGCRGGTATVTAFMNCGSVNDRKYSNTASININRVGFSSSLGIPSGYTGPKCGNTSGVTFTAASLPCATTYRWTATNTQWKDANGALGPWTTSTNTLDLYPQGNSTDDGTIAVDINIGCATLTQTYRAVYTNPALATPTFASSNVKVLCSGGAAGTVSINSVPQAASYRWYSTDNLLINGVAATSANPVVTTTLNVTVTPPTTSYVGFVNVRVKAARANANCAGSAEGVYPIWMGKPGASNSTLIFPPGKRGVDPVTLAASNSYQFACDFVTGAGWYTWTLPSGFSFVSGSTTSTPGIKTSATTGTYILYCAVNNACGYSYTHSLGIILSTGGGQQQAIAVYPNPADSELNVLVETESSQQTLNETIEIALINKNQKKVYSTKTASLHTIIPLGNLPAGNYYLHITNKDGLSQRQIVIDR